MLDEERLIRLLGGNGVARKRHEARRCWCPCKQQGLEDRPQLVHRQIVLKGCGAEARIHVAFSHHPGGDAGIVHRPGIAHLHQRQRIQLSGTDRAADEAVGGKRGINDHREIILRFVR